MREVIPLRWGDGWYPLTREGIEENVSDGEPGCYILAKLHGEIVVETRSGRSLDLYSRLNDHRRNGYYDVFRYGVSENDLEELYYMECDRYHNLKGVIGLGHGEKIHPAKPDGMDIECPHCGR